MGELIPPTRKPRVIKRFARMRPSGEVMKWVYDVVRIIGDSKHHVIVYRGLADTKAAEYNKQYLHDKTGDTCYIVGRKTRRVTIKRGTRN